MVNCELPEIKTLKDSAALADHITLRYDQLGKQTFICSHGTTLSVSIQARVQPECVFEIEFWNRIGLQGNEVELAGDFHEVGTA